MEAVADLLAHDVEVVITHGNGPQVGNLLVKNELAAAVVPPVPLDWCGAQTQATLGFVLMDALEAALARPGGRSGATAAVVTRTLVDRDDPGFTQADQADRPLPPGRGGAAAGRPRRDLGGPRREGLAARGRLARAAARSSTRRRCRRWSRPGSSWSPTAVAASPSSARPTARCAASRRSSTRTSAPRCWPHPSRSTCSSSPPTSTTRCCASARPRPRTSAP